MALIRINDFIEDDARQSNSVELMASWQAWLSSHDPFVKLNSGDNSLRIAPGAFFALSEPFRWYRVVDEQEVITQAVLDVGGNYKSDTTYHLFLVADGTNGHFSLSESAAFPLGTDASNALWLAQFRTGNNGVIVGNSIYDSQMKKFYEDLYPIGHELIQLPTQRSPQDRFPFLNWLEITASYGGDFLRFAGGLAGEFGQGIQAMSAPNIEGTWVGKGLEAGFMSYTGSYYEIDREYITSSGHSANTTLVPLVGIDASRSNAAYGRREEIAPQNQSIRIWRRVGVITGVQQVAKLDVEGQLLEELDLPVDSAGVIGYNPNCMTTVELPKATKSRAKKDEVMVFNRETNQWQAMVDHRGKIAYSVNGQRKIFSIGDDLRDGESWDKPLPVQELLPDNQLPIEPTQEE